MITKSDIQASGIRTITIVIEDYSKDQLELDPEKALYRIKQKALMISNIHKITGKRKPDVVS